MGYRFAERTSLKQWDSCASTSSTRVSATSFLTDFQVFVLSLIEELSINTDLLAPMCSYYLWNKANKKTECLQPKLVMTATTVRWKCHRRLVKGWRNVCAWGNIISQSYLLIHLRCQKARELEIKEVSKEPMRRGSGSWLTNQDSSWLADHLGLCQRGLKLK